MKPAAPQPTVVFPQRHFSGPLATEPGSAHFRSVVETASDAIVSVDGCGTVVFWNDAAEKIFGYAAEEMLGESLDAIVPPWAREKHRNGMARALASGQPSINWRRIEMVGVHKDRTEFPIELSLGHWQQQGEHYFTGILRDIRDRKQTEEALRRSEQEYRELYQQMKEVAETDKLTGIFNRHRIHAVLDNEIERGKRGSHLFSIMMLDVDGLKPINDTYGHPVGDRLLQHVADVVSRSRRSIDTLGRYGGDEFVLVLPYTHGKQANVVANSINRNMAAAPFRIDGTTAIVPRLSIGIATFPLDSSRAPDLIALADKNMYEAKRMAAAAFSSTPQDVQQVYDKPYPTLDVLKGLAMVVDAKDTYNKGHAGRVAEHALALGRRTEVSRTDLNALHVASWLHDIGKIGIPDRILHKSGPLAPEEFDVIKEHPRLSVLMLDCSVRRDPVAVQAILHHHERYDGTGYPRGLAGKQIPLLARIVAIADAFCAMTSARPYRPALSAKEAVDTLERNAGTQFDPELVDTFVSYVNHPAPAAMSFTPQA